MIRLLVGDCRDVVGTLPDESVHCCVTSPPYYGLRDYGVAGQIGLEASPDEYVAALVSVFHEVRRVLRQDGTLWLIIGDSYAGNGIGWRPGIVPGEGGNQDGSRNRNGIGNAGCKPKDLIGIPWLVAFALRADGWYLRQDIIWSKPNPMPESVTDRCTKAHEYLFLLSRSERYWFDAVAIAEYAETNLPTVDKSARSRHRFIVTSANGSGRDAYGSIGYIAPGKRNKRSVWTVASQPFAEAHFATFPPALIEPCILAGCPEGGTVLDPFGGAGTTGLVADRLQRNAILIELSPAYAAMARHRIADDAGMFAEMAAE